MPNLSLPSIHELFPEHLFDAGHPRTSCRARREDVSSTRNSHTSSTSYSHPPSSSTLHIPQNGLLKHQTTVYHSDSRPHVDYNVQRQCGPLPPMAPHPVDVHSSSRSSAQSSYSSTSARHHPHHRSARQDHVPGRYPRSRDGVGHPDTQPIASSDPSQSAWTLPGPSVASPQNHLDSEMATDEETPGAGGSPGLPRKHVCSVCHKPFNRPSSLKIHLNTHTGATPFRCPYPQCGREFNVNSNMRRHLRNHKDDHEMLSDNTRRRRRRSSAASPMIPQSTEMEQSLRESGDQTPRDTHPHNTPYPYYGNQTHVATSSYAQTEMYEDYQNKMKLDEYYTPEDAPRSHRVSAPMTLGKGARPEAHGTPAPLSPSQYRSRQDYLHQQYPESSASLRNRASTPGSSFHSSSPSSTSMSLSPFSPPLSIVTTPNHSPAALPYNHASGPSYQYSPSMPYLRGSRDTHVSTALRPAFGTGGSGCVTESSSAIRRS